MRYSTENGCGDSNPRLRSDSDNAISEATREVSLMLLPPLLGGEHLTFFSFHPIIIFTTDFRCIHFDCFAKEAINKNP